MQQHLSHHLAGISVRNSTSEEDIQIYSNPKSCTTIQQVLHLIWNTFSAGYLTQRSNHIFQFWLQHWY